MNNFKWSATAIPAVLLWALGASAAQAATTVTVDSDDKVVVNQAVAAPAVQAVLTPVVVTPVVLTQEATLGDFEGRIAEIDGIRHQIVIQDAEGRVREVSVQPEMINSYRIGDYVHVHPTTAVTLITMEENPKEFEGEIIRVDTPNARLVVLDTNGRERKIDIKKGMINQYKVDDYIRVHLMSDLKEARTIETVSNVRNIEGTIVNIDAPASRLVLRGSDGKDSTVLVRQGQIQNYRAGDHVRIYLLQDRDQVQVIRVLR